MIHMVIAVRRYLFLSLSKDIIIKCVQPGMTNPKPKGRIPLRLLFLKELHTVTAGVWLLHLNRRWMLLICSAALGYISKRDNELLEATAPQPHS